MLLGHVLGILGKEANARIFVPRLGTSLCVGIFTGTLSNGTNGSATVRLNSKPRAIEPFGLAEEKGQMHELARISQA